MSEHLETGTMKELSPAECWALLRSQDLGRLAVTTGGAPLIFPVNYAVDHGCVVLRTAPGTKLAAALTSDAVAFEADAHDRGSQVAWSVMIQGQAEEMVELEELLDADDLPLSPLHPSPKHRFLRIVPTEVSGRRFATVPGDFWHGPLSGRRRAPRD
ncbi:pyridoxamine 5'-phosphate oxidase family protein [Kineosporia sp. J2-2]|uniref:Pyridoxamine 5'-phosphate oxidase family protein n=1 Tax=Kineosporia corallincola TaxID=2835133 RepID=A0ABS5TQ25_9ACTN|nr:pyridoxamine 5'-phosphate oxidase family protein [Kineosporia corallincola]MBT0773207.1 pyridoxamine 5'-phosphate oxidase family protein [Kineosporia corallincola]